MAALSAYENAEPEDILDTDRSGAASIRLLLRRASSPDYLSEEHRLPLTSSRRKALLKLVALRNQTLHILPDDGAPVEHEFPQLAKTALEAIEHLVVTSPAMRDSHHSIDRALIVDYIDTIKQALSRRASDGKKIYR